MKVTTEGERGHRPALGRHRRAGLRAGHVLRDGRERHPRAAEARGHRAREHGARPEVHGAYFFMPAEYPPFRTREERPTTRSSGPGAGARASRRSASTTGARSTTASRTCRTSRGSSSRPRRSGAAATAPPDEDQQRDLGFMLTLGELFTLVVYGQLILEQAELTGTGPRRHRPDLRRAGARLLGLRDRPARQVDRPQAQQAWALGTVRKPVGRRAVRARLAQVTALRAPTRCGPS